MNEQSAHLLPKSLPRTNAMNRNEKLSLSLSLSEEKGVIKELEGSFVVVLASETRPRRGWVSTEGYRSEGTIA